MNQDQIDTKWMKICLELAADAASRGEVPVGAIVVCDDQILGQGANQREATQNPTRHAEIIAIEAAAEKIGSWRLLDSTLHVTLEPCPMCAGAILQARIPRVVYGAKDPKAGAVESLYNLLNDSRLNHRCEVTNGILDSESRDLLQSFFKTLRLR